MTPDQEVERLTSERDALDAEQDARAEEHRETFLKLVTACRERNEALNERDEARTDRYEARLGRQRAEAERDTLRAEVERLTRDRDAIAAEGVRLVRESQVALATAKEDAARFLKERDLAHRVLAEALSVGYDENRWQGRARDLLAAVRR